MVIDIDAAWKREQDDVINVVADIECPSARIQYAFQAGCLAGREIIAQVVDERMKIEARVAYLEGQIALFGSEQPTPQHGGESEA